MICLCIDNGCPEIPFSVGKCPGPIKWLTECCCVFRVCEVRGGMESEGDGLQVKHMNTVNKKSLWCMKALTIPLDHNVDYSALVITDKFKIMKDIIKEE